MNKFKVGDKVVIIDGRNIKSEHLGWVGEMTSMIGQVHEISMSICDGTVYRLQGARYSWDKKWLKPYCEKITIERHGQKMVAKYNGKVGVAKCSDDDEFDVFIGANLALQRLFGKEEKIEEPKWSEGDIVRAKGNPFVDVGTIGRIRMVDHQDKELPAGVKFENHERPYWMRSEQLEKLDI